MKKILISGATGLIGQKLVEAFLAQGMTVHYLSTGKSKLKTEERLKGFYWNPKQQIIDTACFEGVSVIINLAGASIAKRWTPSYKEEIMNSRIQSIDLLAKSVKELNIKIDHFISASAIGYYPSSEINFYDENYKSESDAFLVKVVRQWEAAARQFTDLGITETRIRIGLVLAEGGGALEELAKPIRSLAGSALGTGKQWQSWIHIDDVVGIFMYCLNNKITGPVNAVAPNPVTNKVLVHAIAKTLNRFIILPNVPVSVLKLMLGEMHVIITEGQRVSSKKIEDLGYAFQYYQLDAALEDLLKA
ncbi:MAG: TIGR01777 family protein [Flavobacteriaceae bacterium]|nr:TIGR01777 family oxidoreductase [Bacteroidia bacterium]MBT8286445.1 TIGR01777 family oxidoreductase [Bacteroidia bacterium]NNF75721.1 TIGR01777 family protein [Flavobacteriaceae bacterium]NNK74268.1 TIGR01777 family protein [Flavobacteriaceae bacterium]